MFARMHEHLDFKTPGVLVIFLNIFSYFHLKYNLGIVGKHDRDELTDDFD